ncbi:MAG: PQQ-binding-like beta-propeller repeat protein, partial [Myxococcota bacterium]|nr:PQQ-binding-like beta-propeller repeat protein [Myxococcota bacterium]
MTAGKGIPARAMPLLALVAGCGGLGSQDEPQPISVPCAPSQPTPYADGIPYLGVHADAANSDVVRCVTSPAYTEVWHALEGLALTQPNTFSPDGTVTYVTTTHFDPDGCRLHALDVETGQVQWCSSFAPSITSGSVEVDSDGHLYFTGADRLVSLDDGGDFRWEVVFTDAQGESDAPWGLHLNQAGHVVTVTSTGVVFLVDRSDGVVLDSLDIGQAWGFVAPDSMGLDIELSLLLPDEVVGDIETVWGPLTDDQSGSGFASFLGA